MNHNSYVTHLDVQSVFLLHHIFLTSTFCFQLFVKFFFHKLSALNLSGLGCEFLLDYLSVNFIEVLLQIIFDEDERHHKVISCMVRDAIIIEKMVQALSHQVILHKLMIRLAVVLISDSIIMILSRNLKVVNFLRIHLMVFRFGCHDCW